MRPDKAPCFLANRLDLPSAITSCFREQPERSYAVLGSVLPDTKLAWLSKGPLLQVVDTKHGSKVSAWNFGAVVKDFKTKVTCVEALPDVSIAGHVGSTRQLLVGLECELTGGMLCVFNLAGSRVLRAINIPSKITTLSLISAGGSIGPLNKSLKSVDGLVAAGTSNGQVLLIDLKRKKCDESLHSSLSNFRDCPRDELRPCALSYVRPKSQQRIHQHPDDHFCLHLNEKAFSEDHHLRIEFPSKESESFLPEDPSITSLLYVPQLASLCVGFACGTFQIWSLQSLLHLYSFPVEDVSPIVKMSFQEACDDPNAYCYLWTVKGRSNMVDVSAPGPGCATLYSLCYDEKKWLPGYGYLYQQLMMCSPRFEYELSDVEGTIGGRLISFSCVSRGGQGQLHVVNPAACEDSASGTSSNVISLCLMVWETWGTSGPKCSIDPKNTHMALFDLNQWYADQMPGHISVRGGPSRNKTVAGYFAAYDFGEALSSCEGLVVDVRLRQETLLQFSSIQNVEEFSRPASLCFSSVVVTDQQIIHLQHPGVQRALLSGLVSAGPGALISPTNIFHECLALGLRPLLMDISSSIHVSLEEQRMLILNVALEQHLGSFVYRCAREWADGRFAAANCTLSWLLSAVWNRAAVLKQLAVRICTQLFDYSGEKLDSNAQQQLRHVLNVFHSLQTFYHNVVQNKWHLSLSEWQQVELQKSAIELECKYYDVLQWFIDVNLLPEGLDSSIPYPSEDLRNYYHTRRQEIQCLQQAKEEDENECVMLMIDALMKNEPGGANIITDWERDSSGNVGPGLFPPASLQGLLRSFLIKDVSLDVKYSIVIYVLMDLADMLNNQQYETALQKLMQFPAAFRMSLCSMRMTQAFWHLDHKGFDTAVDMLLDPLISTRDMKPWQHRCLTYLLLLQGQPRLALRYVRARQPPLEDLYDIRIHLNLLLANDLINEAFMFQRSHRSLDSDNSLLVQFFKGCEERNNLKSIVQFSLEDEEEEVFAQYLEKCKHPAADDLRVLYLLKRSRFVEALDVNQELRKKGKTTATRDVVVNAFFKTLPSMTRSLAAHCATQQNKLQAWKKIDRPTPLFVNVKSTSPEMRYKSSFIQTAVEKSLETWSKLVNKLPPKVSEVESTPFLCTPRTRIKSRLSRLNSVGFSTVGSDAVQPFDNKRKLEDGDESQAKRRRFQELEGALAELQHQQTPAKLPGRNSTLSCVDALPLLHTPIIQRRSPASRMKLQQEILSNSPAHRNITPQSIIKVRRSGDSAHSESPSRSHILFQDPELTEEESENELSPAPRGKGESDTDSEIEVECPLNKQGKSIVRRTIDFESDTSSSESLLQSSCNESHFLPSHSPSPAGTPVQTTLSKMVVLSEAWKVGKPHNVTFGKHSICIYDEDEPLDSERALQNEKASDEEDQDTAYLSEESDALKCDEQPKEPQPHPSSVRLDRLNTSGFGTLEASAIEGSLGSTVSNVFTSPEGTPSESLTSVSFRSRLSRPPIKHPGSNTTEKSPHISEEISENPILGDENINVYEPDKFSSSLSADTTCSNFLPCPIVTTPHECDAGAEEEQGKEEVCSISDVSQTKFEDPSPQERSKQQTPPLEPVSPKESTSPTSLKVNEIKHIDVLLSQEKASVGVLDTGSEESTLGCSDNVTGGQLEEVSDSEEDIVELDQEDSGFLPESSGILTSLLDEDADEEPFNFPSRGMGSQFDSEGSQSTLSLGSKLKNMNSTSAVEKSELVSNYKNTNENTLSNSDFDPREPDFNDSQISLLRESQNLDNSVSRPSEDDSNYYGLRPEVSQSPTDEALENKREEYDDSSSKDKSQPSVPSRDGYQTSEATEDLQLQIISVSSAAGVNILDDVKGKNCEEQIHPQNRLTGTSPSKIMSGTAPDAQNSDFDENEMKEENSHQEEMPSLQLDSSFEETGERKAFLSPEVRCTQSPTTDQRESVSSKKTTSFSGILSFQSDPTPIRRRKSSSPLSDHNLHNTSISSDISGVSTRSKARTAASQPSPSPDKSGHNSSSISDIMEVGVTTRSKSSGTSNTSLSKKPNKSQNIKDKVDDIASPTVRATVQSPRRSTRLVSSLSSEEVTKPSTRSRRSSLSSVKSLDTSIEESKQLTRKKGLQKLSTELSGDILPDNESRRLPEQKLARISEDDSASEKASVAGTPSSKRKRVADSPQISNYSADISPQTPKRSRNQKKSAGTLDECQTPSVSQSHPKEDAILKYATTRRLTRHQHAMLTRSLEASSDYVSSVKTVDPVKEEEQEDQESDEDRASVSSIRSSLRLREKNLRQATASPSSTASTIINPGLTPTSGRRRRQSLPHVDDRGRDSSPVSSRKGRRSLPSPSTPSRTSTPTRRPTRQKSKEEDDRSASSVSPSSTTSSMRRASRGRGRRLSVSSETPSEQFEFAAPETESVFASIATAGIDTSGSESFPFSPPRMVTQPSRSSSPSVDSNGSAPRRSTRQTRKSILPVINEESSSLMSQNNSPPQSRKQSSSKRRSWYFFKEEEEKAEESGNKGKKSSDQGKKKKPEMYSAFPVRKEFEVIPLPAGYDSEQEDETRSSDLKRTRRSHRSATRGRRTKGRKTKRKT